MIKKGNRMGTSSKGKFLTKEIIHTFKDYDGKEQKVSEIINYRGKNKNKTPRNKAIGEYSNPYRIPRSQRVKE